MKLLSTFTSTEEFARIPVSDLLPNIGSDPCAGTSLALDRLSDPKFGVLHARLIADVGARVTVYRDDNAETDTTTFSTALRY